MVVQLVRPLDVCSGHPQGGALVCCIALRKLEYSLRRGRSATRDVLSIEPLIPFIQGLLGQSQVGKLRLARNAHQ